ncbi:MAG: hypothetical protein IT365_20570 [Candidatus Hydrogenedentes bacterium]|nr:hypothetical protein [Candidatus Hydrogenedentota bacterium]
MDFFKRISDLMTPPPETEAMSAANQQAALTLAQPDPPSATLGQLVKTLVAAPDLEHPSAVKAVAELKAIANQSGLYVVASKMRYQLDAMPRADVNGIVNWKDRAYVLAADFIYQHITREIRAIEAEERPTSPNIFRSYCNELVACLLYGKNVRRAIEMPVMIVEDLVHMAFDSGRNRDGLIELADVLLVSTVTQSLAKFETDQRERVRRRQEAKRGDIPSTPPSDPVSVLSADCVAYAQRLQGSVEALRKGCSALPAVPLPTPQAEVSERAKFAQYIQQLAGLADRAGYTTCSATLRIRLGAIIESSDPPRTVALYRHAASQLEALGSAERALLFTKLSARRFRLAAEIYARIGEPQKAATLQMGLVGQ